MKSKQNRRACSAICLAAAAVHFALPVSSRAATSTNWSDTSSDWNNSGNWSAGIPNTLNETVNITNSDATSRVITYDYPGPGVTLGTVNISNNGGGSDAMSMTTAGLFLVSRVESIGGYSASTLAGIGLLSQSAGTNEGSFLYVGYNLTDTGTYTLSGSGTLVNNSEYFGFGGDGSFNQSGSTYNSAFNLSVGFNAGSTGTYTLSGSGSLAITSETIGVYGIGIVNQSGGANQVGNALFLASVGQGTYSLSQTGTLTAIHETIGAGGAASFVQTGGVNTMSAANSELDIGSSGSGSYALSGGVTTDAGSVYVGGSSSGTGGMGVLTVSGSGVLNIAGTLAAFNTAGTNINLNSGGTIYTPALDFHGVPSLFVWGNGTLNLTQAVTFDPSAASNSTSAAFGSSLTLAADQVLNVTGNEILGGAAAFTLALDGGPLGATNTVTGALTVHAGSTFTLANASTSNPLLTVGAGETIGDIGTGSFVQSAGLNSVGTPGLVLGGNSTGLGIYLLSGGSVGTGSEIVGSSGSGIFNQNGGTNAVSTALSIAANTGATGSYTLSAGTLTAANVFLGSAGTYTQTGGTATFGKITGNGQFTISGGKTSILPNSGTSTIAALKVNIAGLLDIANNTIDVNYASPAGESTAVSSIVAALANGYNGGAWTGTAGIVSSTAASGGGVPKLSVGYADGNVDSGDSAAPNQVVIKYTLAGDANLDGSVNFTDLGIVGQHLNTTGNDWAHGNFTYAANGAVNFTDLGIVGQNLNKLLIPAGSSGDELGGATLGIAQTTAIQNTLSILPEPTSIALAAAGAAGLLARRKRRTR